jgi:hypothetical protein
MGVLTKLNRYQAIRTPLNGSRDVVSHDTCPASSNGSVDEMRVQPSLLQQIISTMPVVTTIQVLLPQQYLGQIPRFSAHLTLQR